MLDMEQRIDVFNYFVSLDQKVCEIIIWKCEKHYHAINNDPKHIETFFMSLT